MNGLGSCFGIRMIFLMIAISCHIRKESHSKQIEFSHLQWVLSMGKYVAMKSIDLTRKNQPYSATEPEETPISFCVSFLVTNCAWFLGRLSFSEAQILRSQKRLTSLHCVSQHQLDDFFVETHLLQPHRCLIIFAGVFFGRKKQCSKRKCVCF